MDDKIRAIWEGVIGQFWIGATRPKPLTRKPEGGHLSIHRNERIDLALLDETAPHVTHQHPVYPRVITGITESGGVVLLDIFRTARRINFGGAKASVRKYSARSVAVDVDVVSLRSARVRSIEAHFFGVSTWFGLSAVTENWEHHTATNRLKSWSITVASPEEQRTKMSGGREIIISGHWRVSGRDDRRSVNAPISVACRSQSPKDLVLLRSALLRVQDLISLAYGGFLPAGSARLLPDADDVTSSSQLWDEFLMKSKHHLLPEEDRELPYFSSTHVGGIAGIKRWVELATTHTRAIRPLVERYRQGLPSPPLRLLEVASGIEYWVAANRRTSKWADKKCRPRGRHDCGPAWTLAEHVGAPFSTWIGEPHLWASKFWSTYNNLKHDPSYNVDERDLSLLAESGRLLLASAILNRVSLTKAPSREIFKEHSHRTWRLRDRLRDLL